MAEIVRMSDATALALHSLAHLALEPDRQYTTSEIAKIFGASRHHLAKVHQKLAKAGILHSQRGPAGGVRLARPPAEITLLEIYELIEGPILRHPCLFGFEICPRKNCMLKNFLPHVVQQVKEYLEKTTLADLASHALIGYDTETPFLRGASKRFPIPWGRERFALRADSDLAQLALIRAGAGIGVCQVALARRDRQLVRVLPDQAAFQLDTWITMHEDLRASPRCKTVFDALVACLLAHTGAAG